MTPPPPPPGFSWRARGPRLDPALDDSALVTARDALAQGRWGEARTLLIETGDDWERRGHRLTVLAEDPNCRAWADDWQLTEPDSTDAAALLACATALRAARGKQRPEKAREAAAAASRAVPDDPTPWLALLLLARHTGDVAGARDAFRELHARCPRHQHGHQLMAAVLAGSAEVYDFARHAAGNAPADSPLALLPVIAHAERFRALADQGVLPSDPAQTEHWESRHAQHTVRVAFDWWLEWDGRDRSPRRVIGLNYLTHAKFHEGRMAEAAALFQRISSREVTPEPWSYTGRDPREAFRAARRAVLGYA